MSVVALGVLCGCDSSPGVAPEIGMDVVEDLKPDVEDTCDFYRHPTLDLCVQCLTDDHCLSGLCDPNAFQCVACYDDSHCADGVCLPGQNFCVGCFSDEHCGSGSCDLEKQECVGCGEDAECDDGNPCTIEVCEDGQCAYVVAEGIPCDNDPCQEEVCGLDGQCVLSGVATPGACVQACETNADCDDSHWCLPDEACGAVGSCVERPTDCSDVVGLNLVCGCDSVTYQDQCLAEQAGTAVAYIGECECIGEDCCEGRECCAEPPLCPSGSLVDVDGDGCDDTCCALPPECGLAAIDTNGDGCVDTCPCEVGDQCPAGTYCLQEACGEVGTCQACAVATTDTPLVCTCEGEQLPLAELCGDVTPWVVSTETQCCPSAPACPLGEAVDVDGDGCAESCGCTNTSCDSGELCAPSGCGESSPSICQPCLDDSGPVCGCDGVTYGSQCKAISVGVAVVYGGPCQCSIDEPCVADDQVCDPASCADNAVGQCIQISAAGKPVCGCDGVTYASVLDLKAAGAAIDYTGCCELLCDEPGTVAWDTDGDGCVDDCVVGCTSSQQCDDGYCARPGCSELGSCVTPASADGFCPPACTCDGTVVENPCAFDAAVAVAPVDSTGAACATVCTEPGCPEPQVATDTNGDGCKDECVCPQAPSCGDLEFPAQVGGVCDLECVPFNCATNDDCGLTHYCYRTACNAEVGTCESKFAECESDGAEVCGCDGTVYASPCDAQKAGVNVSSDAACVTVPPPQ